jgi:hypothetical protein
VTNVIKGKHHQLLAPLRQMTAPETAKHAGQGIQHDSIEHPPAPTQAALDMTKDQAAGVGLLHGGRIGVGVLGLGRTSTRGGGG